MSLEPNFERLAPELLLPILTHLPDLESLDSILRASPAAFRVFNSFSTEIFEPVLQSASSSYVMHEYTCALIRIVALVRESALPPGVHDIDSFEDFVRHETTSHRYDPPRWTAPSVRISSAISIRTMRHVIAKYRQIACLTTSCLDFYLARFRALRPSHLVDDTFLFENKLDEDGNYFPASVQTPKSSPFPVRDTGVITWIERQRVLRAFWRVELFHEIKYAVKTLRVRWPENSIWRMGFMTAERFSSLTLRDLIGVHYCEYGPDLYHQEGRLEKELIRSVINYMKEDGKNLKHFGSRDDTRYEIASLVYESGDVKSLEDYTSWTYAFFHQISGTDGRFHVNITSSPLEHITFDPFRRLGFAIWNTDRMVGYGLLDPKYASFDYKADMYFMAWKSILSDDELVEMKRRDREQYDRMMKTSSEDESSEDEVQIG